ncbi:REJ domain [Chlorella sorokiniana]|uniref:REJ domain n=1 Tax=Chlorella sorokiniana TaxID=3076 RepID=A0A2P6TML7_CHLSO|nr:REJ domain [Chlorella sorokiniana]|eukprot:PRW45572.1 REJ domain [Chlorella sorokiniana]
MRAHVEQRAREFSTCLPRSNNPTCTNDASKGCATCAPAPNQNNCASCTNPNHVVDPATGRCGPRPNNNEPCKQDAAKGCATCAPAPNQNNCATCTNPNNVVDPATGRCGPRPNNNEPCKQDVSKGCATCAPAPNQNNCATCSNPAHIVTNGRCGPRTFTPVNGTMLSDNRGIGFNGRPITYQGRIGEMIDIVSAAPFWSLNGRLIRGSRWSSRSLGSVTWTYDNKVHVELKHGRMMVWVNGRLQRQGPVMALSSKTKCHVRSEKCHKGGWCDNRTVDITRPGISITVSQPFVRQGRKGYFGNWLEVQVTLQAEPRQQLTGYLGQTILLRAN